MLYYTNLTIFAEDKEGTQLKTTYLVYTEEGTLYDGGITDKYGGVLQRVTTNNSYRIRNENLYGQEYYTTEIKFSSNTPNKNNRIVLELEERGELGIKQEGRLGTNETILLELSENQSFHNLVYCLKWGESLIFVSSKKDKLQFNVYDDNYKCYNPLVNLNEEQNFTIEINYNTITSLTENDYIRVQFYDNDELLSQNYTKRQEYFLV